jgi:hypothetical protein
VIVNWLSSLLSDSSSSTCFCRCLPENHLPGELCACKYLFSLKYIAQIWSDFRCYPSCSTGGINGFGPSCSPECFQYRGTMDVFSKVTRQASACSAFLFPCKSSVVMIGKHLCRKEYSDYGGVLVQA